MGTRWKGMYTENGKHKYTHYQFNFHPSDGTFCGSGTDADGKFIVENGVYCLTSGRLAWGERSQTSSLYTDSRIEARSSCGSHFTGRYRSNTGTEGRMSLHPMA